MPETEIPPLYGGIFIAFGLLQQILQKLPALASPLADLQDDGRMAQKMRTPRPQKAVKGDKSVMKPEDRPMVADELGLSVEHDLVQMIATALRADKRIPLADGVGLVERLVVSRMTNVQTQVYGVLSQSLPQGVAQAHHFGRRAAKDAR